MRERAREKMGEALLDEWGVYPAQRIMETLWPFIAAALAAAEREAIEKAAKVVENTDNGMRYGPGVDDFTIASIDSAVDSIREEIARDIRALATPESPTPPEARHG